MYGWIKRIATWLGVAGAAIITLAVAFFLERREGAKDAEAKLAKKDRLDRIEEAGAKGDLDALDEEWRER